MKPRSRHVVENINQLPIVNSEIVMAVSLMLFFTTFAFPNGYTRLILGHITFCTPYVVLSVMPRLMQMDPNIYEAALDLGQAHDLVERVHGVLEVGGLLEERDHVQLGHVDLVREGEVRELVDVRHVLGRAGERDDVAARGVVQGFVAAVVQQQVVAYAASDEALLDAGQGVDGAVDVEQRTVVGVEIGTHGGVDTRGAPAAAAALRVASVHPVHVGRRPPEVRQVALEVGHLGDGLHLA